LAIFSVVAGVCQALARCRKSDVMGAVVFHMIGYDNKIAGYRLFNICWQPVCFSPIPRRIVF